MAAPMTGSVASTTWADLVDSMRLRGVVGKRERVRASEVLVEIHHHLLAAARAIADLHVAQDHELRRRSHGAEPFVEHAFRVIGTERRRSFEHGRSV